MKILNIYKSKLIPALLFLFFLTAGQTRSVAQILPSAVNADPSAKAVSQIPLGSTIAGNATIRFRFANEASSANSTGLIPPNSVRLTISFPGRIAFNSINSITKFAVEDFDNQPAGVVHLVNNQLILEGEVIDLLLNVRGTALGTGTITFNSDRTTPIIVGNVQTSNDNAQATFTVTAIGVLPLHLLSFNAQKQNCNAAFTWKTSDEVNTDRFELELSTDAGRSFSRVGTVPSTNTPGNNNYTYNYTMQGDQTHLFRLKMIDTKGDFTYSQVARINGGCGATQETVLLYPSPTRSRLTLNVSNPSLVNTRAAIFDMSGRRAMSFQVTGTAMNVYVDKLTPGLYMIRLANGTTVKFVKE
jgi:hypothetical protein